MSAITGKLTATGEADFTGYRVAAVFEVSGQLEEGESSEETREVLWTIAKRVTAVGRGGAFEIPLPEDGTWRGPITLTASSPAGRVLARLEVDEGGIDGVELTVGDVGRPVIEASDDPTRGRRERLTGRVIDPKGRPASPGLLVVLWGVPEGGEDADAVPLLIATTTADGYFSEAWPPDSIARAFGVVAGGEAVPIPVDGDRLPHSVVLVLSTLPDPPDAHVADDDCECGPDVPQAPEQDDLVQSSAFSGDLGGRCVSLTVPNRALEEVTFHAVVRTSQPEVKGLTLEALNGIPEPLAKQLAELLSVKASAKNGEGPERMRMLRASGADETALGDATLLAGPRETTVAAAVEQIDPMLLQEAVRSAEQVDVQTFSYLSHASTLKRIAHLVGVVTSATPGRVTLDEDHEIDWDDTPTTYQATTIAHGHLLTLKQVWRSDGYSLGDLLYSLPLAPGQRKQIAVLDWDRRETAARLASRRETETLAADLVHDRDISEILNSSLRENSRGHSESNVSAVGGGIGGFIGPVVFGVAGGYSSSSSSAWQRSSRDVAASSLSQMRDRTAQASSAVRSQRATVVQTARQGESLRVQTEVVANHNHCHAVSIEYFEVLRHFLVSHELAGVQEALFVPFDVSKFTSAKALRWREPLGARLRRPDLRFGFDALERVRTNWADADFPTGRYADEEITYLDGELWISFALPRPRDTATDGYDAAQWAPYAALLSQPTQEVWDTHMGVALPADRNRVWNQRIAPRVADRLVNTLEVELSLDGGSATVSTALDTTLVSGFAQDRPLLVSLRPEISSGSVVRTRVTGVRIVLPAALPAAAKVVVHSGSMRYRTDHIDHPLFGDFRILNDLSASDAVDIPTPLTQREKHNPREADRRLGDTLVAHLNQHVEYYHQAIWWAMDPNRRYLLLDGFVAPNSGGRSVASVVENRLVGIVGNCLVMPVVPGVKLDPGYDPGENGTGLADAYITGPPMPIRVSVPTRGVFAESVMGVCNSCEKKDDTRFWRWEESPLPDALTPIEPVSTQSRRTSTPDLSPDEFPAPLVRMQNAPRAPDPTGLAAALELIGTPNLFKDITGLDLTQRNAAEAFKGALDTAKFFGSEAGKLAQQKYLAGDMDRNLERIKDARDRGLITDEQANQLTQSAIRGSVGGRRAQEQAPTSSPAVQRAIDRAAQSRSSTLRVTRPGGSVELRSGDHAAGESFDFSVDPPVEPLAQPSENVCWAAAGAMLLSWRDRQSLTVAAAADRAGADWRAKLDADQSLALEEIDAYRAALGLQREAPLCYLPRGLLRLLEAHGPLWVIGDDAVSGNQLAHVRILTGIRGDGSEGGTTVRIVDPDGGEATEMSYAEFTGSMEAEDPVSLGYGVFHF